jgi:exodeoxyribonuclease V gamma subunit
MMHLYSAGSAKPLGARLAQVLADVPADPMTPEWLAVPSDGMRRWLTLELAGHLGSSGPGSGDGVAANIERALPGDLRSAVLAVGRPEGDPDPWRIERLVWSVLAVLAASDEVTSPPDGPAAGGPATYTTARRIADLFDRYHLHRPDMIRQWAAGRPADGSGRPLSDYTRWQFLVWQLVRERIGEPSPPERLPGLLDRLRGGEPLLDLPPRLVFFGFTLLPAGDFLEVTRAVATRHDVHVFLLEPTRLDASALLERSPSSGDGTPRLRSSDATATLIRQPLLRSWGRLHREHALLLAASGDPGDPDRPPVEEVSDPTDPGRPHTLLGRLQHDLRANAAPVPTLVPDGGDRSVQFHACFGETRQVEALRDALLHLLSAPGTDLTEDDVVVLCPALDRFAPLVEAAFGPPSATAGGATGGGWERGVGRGSPALRYRIADRSIRTGNPVLAATSALLELVAGRCDVPSVLEFLGLPPVRERFGFDDDDLAVIGDWMEATQVRWGLDARQRETFGVPGSITTNTWSAALDRLLIGSTVHDDGIGLATGGVAPYGVEGSDVEIAGRLAAVMSHLAALSLETTSVHAVSDWVDIVRRTCSALFASRAELSWQQEGLDRILSALVEDAGGAPLSSTVPLHFTDMRKLLEERLEDTVGRADFFRGGVTVTSMTPLRWLPFRVVCILGMDQTAFGSEGTAGDDLTAVVPRVGDRDPRGEMRQTLLEAVLAAGDHLVVVRDGRDVKTNQAVPRAVVAAELFDAVLAGVDPDHQSAVADRLEIDHPRQAFDERCFEVGGLVEGTAWGFDPGDLAGALARRERTWARPPFLEAPLGPIVGDVVDLADLHRFFAGPTRAFLSQRLQVRLPSEEDDIPTVLPLELSALDEWQVGNRLLQARLSGHTYEEWLRRERALGTLPPGPMAHDTVTPIREAVDGLMDTALRAGMRPGPVGTATVDAELPDGTRVVGSVQLRLPADTPGPARLSYSRANGTHRVAAWLDLMALLVDDPTVPWRSLAVTRSDKNGDTTAIDLVASADVASGRTSAAEALAVAVDCYRRGMSEPIPLFPKFSYRLFQGKDVAGSWQGFHSPGDGDQPAVKLAFDGSSYREIMALPARPDDPDGPKGRAWRYAKYLFHTIATSTSTAAASTSAASTSAAGSGPGKTPGGPAGAS